MKPLAPTAALLVALCSPVAAYPDGAFDGNSWKSSPPEKKAVSSVDGEAVEEDDPRLWVVVSAGDKGRRTAVADAGVSIEEIKGGLVSGVATPAGLARLKKEGIAVQSAVPLTQRLMAEDFPPKDAAFHNYTRMVSALAAIVASGGGAASTFSIGQSREGREIPALRINAAARGDKSSRKPGIVFLGTHHAREHLSTEVPLLLAKYLVERRDEPEIAALLSSRDIYFIPMVNPDGVEADVRGGRYHMRRKNMRPNPDGSVGETHGVDLNRNYGYQWGRNGASEDPDAETYRGPAAFSEPETRAVARFIDANKNITLLLSYHTFSELILYPWGYTDRPIADGKALAAYQAMARAMAGMTGYAYEQSSDLYLTSGDTTDWAWGAHRPDRKIYSFTFELSPKSMRQGGFYPGVAAIAGAFRNNIRPALYLIDLADDPERAAAPEGVTSASLSSYGGK